MYFIVDIDYDNGQNKWWRNTVEMMKNCVIYVNVTALAG